MNGKFVKDPNTLAVVNQDSEAIKAAKERKKLKLAEKARQEQLESEVNGIKNDVAEIKDLLRQVLNGSN